MGDTPLQRSAAKGKEPLLHRAHPVFRSQTVCIVTADGGRFSGCVFPQPDALSLFGKGGDAGDGLFR